MKLIKKIAAIMFAFMMVFSLSTNAKAVETTGTGKITVNDAINGQTYTVYRILKLDKDSYEPNVEESGKDTGIYSYKPNGNWVNFLKDKTAKGGFDYIEIDENDYARWKGDDNDSRRAEFAKRALAWAKEHANDTDTSTKIGAVNSLPANGNTVEFTGLDLGYYLVDSSVGALCSLTTTNETAVVNEKNNVPTINKYVHKANGEFLSPNVMKKNYTAFYGETITFNVVINNFKGADNLIIKDNFGDKIKLVTTSDGNFVPTITLCKFNNDQLEDVINLRNNTDFTITKNDTDFTIKFLEAGNKKLQEHLDFDLFITYNAVVNSGVGIEDIVNTAILTYGDNNTTQDKAYVGSLNIPVLKYTKHGGTVKNLADAQFGLYKEQNCENVLKFTKDNTTNSYNYDSNGDVTTTLTSDENGKIQIKGLAEGTYYLKEIKAPKGYNLLKNPIEVTIVPVVDTTTNKITAEKITVKKDGTTKEVTKVEVENNTGSLLPSTGGMGTTLIYLIGGALVLGSGIVLANKKRAKAK